ncbi:MAG: hypothetical protein AB7F76_16980 [Parvibaculaceae bacterium]
MSSFWPWLMLAGLGLFHGINPAMGWLFAVGLGLNRDDPRIVWLALIPIAIGHGLAILVTVLVVLAIGYVIDLDVLRYLAGAALIALAIYLGVLGHCHPMRIGMQTGLLGLGLWSFLMAIAHGAGLMLVPALIPLGMTHEHHHDHGMMFSSLALAISATAVHTAAMLLATGVVAIAVYHWLGVAILKRGWINFDVLWIAALALAGGLLIIG